MDENLPYSNQAFYKITLSWQTICGKINYDTVTYYKSQIMGESLISHIKKFRNTF